MATTELQWIKHPNALDYNNESNLNHCGNAADWLFILPYSEPLDFKSDDDSVKAQLHQCSLPGRKRRGVEGCSLKILY